MNKKPKWVIFDVGQVLYDYKGFIKDSAKYLNINKEDLQNRFTEILITSELGGLTFEEFWLGILRLQQKEHELQNIMNMWWDIERYVKDTRLLLKELHDTNYSIALFSNNWPNMGKKILEIISKDGVIKEFFESSVEKLRKPDIKFYELAERKMGAKGKEIYFIDDKKENLITANILGWQTFLYRLGKDGGKKSNDKIRKQLL
ncbi:MAG: hypothetical protein COU25_02860 [Candidatus Levybacteria bacterium CG10_big_fil_rev_8_21_14_0_10_35_13]|nr:MAG: hypothetical protein COU25_02860 [Candidatus Levybacteria bacterium CG10_big_fil_rev_8_21_14_0_10_35_13]